MNSFRDMVRLRGAELRIHCRALRKRRRGSRAWNGGDTRHGGDDPCRKSDYPGQIFAATFHARRAPGLTTCRKSMDFWGAAAAACTLLVSSVRIGEG